MSLPSVVQGALLWTSSWSNAILPGERKHLFEAIRDGQTKQTQASVNVWPGAHQTIHDAAKQLGTSLDLQNTVRSILQQGQRMGLGNHDLAALVELFSCSTDGQDDELI